MNGVGKGKVFEGKSQLVVTEKNYADRNTNFRKYVKGLMLGMLSHRDYKTLNLSAKTYSIELKLGVYPKLPEQKAIIPDSLFPFKKVPEKSIKVVK